MSKLFWLQGYYQVKLINTLNQDIKSASHLIVSPGQAHEINFSEDMVKFCKKMESHFGIESFAITKYLMSLLRMMLFVLSVLNPVGNGMKTII